MEKWIPVLVRPEYLDRVSQLIKELETDRGTEKKSESVQIGESEPIMIVEENLNTLWSLEDLRRLAQGSTATTKRWTLAMDVCAESPGAFLPTSEIARRSGMTIEQWRDAPRKISRHLKAHFPTVPLNENGNPVWPLKAKTLPENPGEVSWAISPQMAELWEEVRS